MFKQNSFQVILAFSRINWWVSFTRLGYMQNVEGKLWSFSCDVLNAGLKQKVRAGTLIPFSGILSEYFAKFVRLFAYC